MSTEENKAIILSTYEGFIKSKLAEGSDVYDANFILHLPGGQEIHGPEGVEQLITYFLSAFIDFRITIEDLIAEGDKVVFRSTRTATHTGEWFGIPATGKNVTWTYITICRIEGGRIVEEWGEGDYLGIMQQLGVVPTPGQD